MIDMPLGANLSELMRRLALVTGKADQTTTGDTLPDDAGELAILKHWLNEGYELFMRSDPRWSFLKRDIQITLSNTAGPSNVNGETWRVRLPAFIRGFPSPCHFEARQSDVAVSRLCLRDAGWIASQIAMRGAQTTGTPIYFSCRPIPVDARTGRDGLGKGGSDDWEALFYPQPSREYVIGASFPVRWVRLVEDEDRSLAGPEHDQSIVSAAEYLYKSRDASDMAVRADAERRWKEDLAMSMRMDYAKRLPAVTDSRPRHADRSTWFVGDSRKQITP